MQFNGPAASVAQNRQAASWAALLGGGVGPSPKPPAVDPRIDRVTVLTQRALHWRLTLCELAVAKESLCLASVPSFQEPRRPQPGALPEAAAIAVRKGIIGDLGIQRGGNRSASELRRSQPVRGRRPKDVWAATSAESEARVASNGRNSDDRPMIAVFPAVKEVSKAIGTSAFGDASLSQPLGD